MGRKILWSSVLILSILLISGASGWARVADNVTCVVRSGDPAPGGGTYGAFGSPAFNDRGEFAFTNSQGGPGLYVASEYSSRRIAKNGDPAPGGGNLKFSLMNTIPSINLYGDVAFWASLLAGGEGIFLYKADGTCLSVVRSGEAAPGGGAFNSFPMDLKLNNSTEIAFTARVVTQGGNIVQGVFKWSNRIITAIARTDGPLGISSFDNMGMDDSGAVFFNAQIPNGRSGIYKSSGGIIQPGVLVGDAAPCGGNFTGLVFAKPGVSGQGDLIFRGVVDNGRIIGRFIVSGGSVKTLVLQGDPLSGGGNIFGVTPVGTLNNRGAVAFFGPIGNRPGYPGPAPGICFKSPQRDLADVLVMGGDTLPTGDPLFFYAAYSLINNRGQVGFYAGMPSGEGLFIAISLKATIRIDSAINPKSNGVIPAAILTTPDFDATQIDPLSVTFGCGEAKEAHGKGHLEDVDQDGDTDMVLHFRTQESGIKQGDTKVSLLGLTLDGRAFYGSSAISTVGNGKDRAAKPAGSGEFTLLQNTPNPFNPSTVIRYMMPEEARVTLTVYNIQGQVVARLVDTVQPRGAYDVNWVASRMASGMYFYRLEAGQFSETRRMLLLK